MKFKNVRNSFIAAGLSVGVLSALADKPLRVENMDTGESFEVTVPDGFRMYEFNEEWLDSIPYLLEHARMGEPWAHKAIADCYRHGNGGLPVSFVNAILYYNASGPNPTDWINEFKIKSETDPIVVVLDLLDHLDSEESEKALECIKSLWTTGYHDADIIKDFIEMNMKGESQTVEMLFDVIRDRDTSPDKVFFAIMCESICNCNGKKKAEYDDETQSILMEKLPFLYSVVGENLLKITENEDGDKYEMSEDEKVARRRKGMEYLLKADDKAVLSKRNAQLLYEYYKYNSDSGWMQLSKDDIERIRIIAGM